MSVLVRRVPRLDAEAITQAVSTLLSTNGRVTALEDGLVIVGDSAEVLQAVNEMIDAIAETESLSWVVQFYLVTLTNKALSDFGVDGVPALEVAYTFANASNGGISPDFNLDASLSAILRATKTESGVRLVAEPLITVADGQKGRFQRGDVVLLPKTSTSQYGAEVVTGYQEIETGLILDVGVRETSESCAVLSLDLQISSLVGEEKNQTTPRRAREMFNTQAVVRNGGVYLLGTLERRQVDQSRGAFLTLGRKRSTEDSVIQVWAKVQAVNTKQNFNTTPVDKPAPTPEAGTPVVP